MKIENADSAVATVTGLEVGTYKFTLTVTDDRKLESSDTVTVIVREGRCVCVSVSVCVCVCVCVCVPPSLWFAVRPLRIMGVVVKFSSRS